MGKHQHKKLYVWQEAIEFVTTIYKVTEGFPKSELYGLVSQLRRASVSIPTNIAEGASRNTDAQFVQFLNIAKASAAEVETLLFISKNLDYIDEKTCTELIDETDKFERKIQNLIKKL